MARTLARIRSRLEPEQGLALIMAVGIAFVLGATVTTTVAYSSAQGRQTSRSTADQVALSLAEAGLNNGLAQLYAAANPSMTSALPSEDAPASQELAGGRAEWYGVLADDVWTIVGVGRVRSPTPGAAEIVRRASSRVRLGGGLEGSSNNAIWNYVYADDPEVCTKFENDVEINVPLYVRGDLCLQDNARVTGYALQVGGKLTITGSASVGLPGAPVHEAHIVGGCSVGGGAYVSPCGPEQQVHSEVTPDDDVTDLTKPPVDLAYWYANAKPGPMQPCTSGTFPGGFDGDGVMNASRGTVSLTPPSAYDCRVADAEGNLVGRIAWTPGVPGALVIEGTVFIDGSVKIDQDVTAVYSGRGTLYTSGTFKLESRARVCGVDTCDEAWDPLTNLLAVVAGAPTGASITMEDQAQFQGALYAVSDYVEENEAVVWGPIIADRLQIENSTRNHYVPIGTLLSGMPATYEEVVTLSNEPGSWGP